MHCFVFCLVLQSSWWERERERERAGYFTMFVFLMYCDCYVALRHGAWVGLQCVIVEFCDHTHLFFLTKILKLQCIKCICEFVC